MAYAHARGVIHRDLKPSNVMVGSFGEVQVMEWGLAKVLPQGGIADEARAQPAHETVIMTVRTGSSENGSDSQAGSVLGTPSYMAPEQARGEIERIDERSDVFGLGAILCEILTGQPPFGGESREETRAQAARGDLAEALRRLKTSGVDSELIDLARTCLRPERNRRPRNAGEVARRTSGYLAGVQERVKAAELARVEAVARAEEERKGRRLAVALAASVVVTFGLAGGGLAYRARERTARLMATTRVVTVALADAERLRGQAQSAAVGNLTKWSEAMAAARHARSSLAEGQADQALDRKVAAVLADIEAEQVAAEKQASEVERDLKLLAELEAIRTNAAEHWSPKQVDKEYAAAFRSFGIDLDQLEPEEAGKQLAVRSAPAELATYLDDWAEQRRSARDKKDAASWQRMLAAARTADPDPWRVALRNQIGRNDLEALRRLAADEKEQATQTARTLVLLAMALMNRDDRPRAERVLRQAWRIKPDDFWVNHALAFAHWRGESFDVPEVAVRHLSAAVAIRPHSASTHNILGTALFFHGARAEAMVEYREAIRLRREDSLPRRNLGAVLCKEWRLGEAGVEYRVAVRLEPDSAESHKGLGDVLHFQAMGLQPAAPDIAGRRVDPGEAYARASVSTATKDWRKLDEAVIEYRTALRLKPDWAEAHAVLGATLVEQGNADEGTIELRTALNLRPDYAEAHVSLGTILCDVKLDFDAAINEFRAALRSNPKSYSAHYNLGIALDRLGKLDEAVAEWREVIRLEPDFAPAHYNLGNALRKQKNLDDAVPEYHKAIRLQPDYAEAHCNLGYALRELGRCAEALAELRRGHRLGSKNPGWPYPSAQWVRDAERLLELDTKLPRILSGKVKPTDGAETLALAQLCYDKKLHGSAARLCTEAFEAEPKLADDIQAQHRYNAACAAALAGCGQGKDDPPLDKPAKARWRQQATDWLKAHLAEWSKVLQTGPPAMRKSIPQTLQHWKADPDLAGLRDPEALKQLPEAEQRACQALWAEVDALLARAQTANKR
jgi:serine/threonine-protein kinase